MLKCRKSDVIWFRSRSPFLVIFTVPKLIDLHPFKWPQPHPCTKVSLLLPFSLCNCTNLSLQGFKLPPMHLNSSFWGISRLFHSSVFTMWLACIKSPAIGVFSLCSTIAIGFSIGLRRKNNNFCVMTKRGFPPSLRSPFCLYLILSMSCFQMSLCRI